LKLRSLLLLSLVGLIVIILFPTVGAVASIVDRAAARTVLDDVSRASRVFDDLNAYRESLLRAESRVVAEEPRLKAVVATEDITHETVISVAVELRRALQSSIFVITDADGRLVADVADPSASGDDLSNDKHVSAALKKGEASGLWSHENELYAVHARRLSFGTTTVGVLVVGYQVDDALAKSVSSETGSPVVVVHDGQVVASSLEATPATMSRDSVAKALAIVPDGASTPTEVDLGDARYLAMARTYPGAQGSATRIVTLHSLDKALEPGRRLKRTLYGIAGAALLVAVGIAAYAARGLSRPFAELVTFTRQVAGGNLAARAREQGVLETKELGKAINQMVGQLELSQQDLMQKQRLERELEIAVQIQTALLPRSLEVAGLEVAAHMIPADDVGGDYYDVIPLEDGCWLGIGDVAGHGLRAGLIMLMVQSASAAVARLRPNASSSELLEIINEVLVDNIRNRLQQDEHVTMSLVRYHTDGRLQFAGAHEEILVCRASTGKCDLFRTPGPWIGVRRGLSDVLIDTELRLSEGDVALFYTDGMIEAQSDDKELFGIERLQSALERHYAESVISIRDALLAEVVEWGKVRTDDRSVVVVRYMGRPSASSRA
jgi:sigma-B regulation protein RsbU (phosphoserine phosphatase)